MSKSGWRSNCVALVFLFLFSVGTYAQSPSPGDSLPRTTDSPSSNAGDSLPPSADTTSSPSENSPYGTSAAQRQQAADAEWSLPAGRILDLLQQRPEIAVELKQLLAEKYRDAGLPIQDDGISDEMLYRRIAGDPSFRASATLLLEARGYVTEDEIRETPGLTAVPMNSRMDQSLSSKTGLPAGNTSGAGLLSGDPDALASIDRANPSDTDIDLAQQLDRLQFPPQQSGLDATQQTQRQNGSQQRFPALPRRTPQTDKDRTKTDAGPELLHKPTPYNLLALHDLYTQVPAQQQTLTRFGADVFVRRSPMGQAASSSAQASALDLPIGPDYVLGPGDGLSITIWGGVSQTLSRTVDSSGKIALPEVGPVALAGIKLGQAQDMLQRILAPQFRSAHVDVTLARLRTVRVYVVGDVQRPGAYDLHSLSSPLNALYAAGGPTGVGSLRTLRHMRGATVVGEIDLYDFLLHGIRIPTQQLEDGDTILVPPAGPQITVAGSVKRPAIYELKGETKLSEVLDDAGGIQVTAALRHISVERVAANDHRETLRIGTASDDLPALRHALETFSVMDGDKVVVAPIVPWSNSTVYLEGHVVRPGRVPYQDDMTLTDVIRSYQDLLPEPSEHGEIIRLMPPDLRPETIEFNLTDALAGKTSIPLRPLDTVRITGRYEADAPKVTVRGEVLRPGVYSLSSGMTAGELVKMAGGFTRSALRSDADLASYEVEDGKAISGRRATVAIGEAVQHSGGPGDPPLKSGDVLTVHQVTGWNDIGASVRINGEVAYPGTYGLQEGEKLSSVLRRAGGFRPTAYPRGAILLRLQVRDLEEKSRAQLIHQIETTSVAAQLGTNASGTDQAQTLQLLQAQQDQVLQRLRSQPATGRLVVRIDADIGSWENTPADIELRAGDVLIVPKRPGFILVSGQVYNASAITYVPHETAGWYLKHSGGTTDFANNKEIFIVRANGDVVGRRSNSWYQGDVLSTRLDPGDVIVVPQKIIGGSMFWKNMLITAQLFSSVAIPLAIAGL